jgi:hypothetical protein
MSPKPFLATITDVIKSGIEVPAAKNVRPITYKENTKNKVHEYFPIIPNPTVYGKSLCPY